MRRFAILGTALVLLAAAQAARAQTNNQCDEPGESPDVIVGDIPDVSSYGGIGGISAFSIGTTSCNVGTCWLNWISNTPEHPVIGQNMFRLKNGRFEQIGQSWLKHGFTALAGNVCGGTCMNPGTGARLGVNCSDPYSSGLNGGQTRLGPKFEVNPTTGVYPYPPTDGSLSGNAIYKRLQVHDTDLDPATNAGALYFVEGQYVTHDDASAGNGANNASYRRITVSFSSGNYNISLAAGTTQRRTAGIQAWKANDAGVTEATVSAGGDGLYIIAAKATALGGGIYHYEYAVQNLTSNRGVKLFSVPLPNGAVVTNVGFHDVDYHSGEPFDGTDWTSTIQPNSISWSTQDFEVNPNANALRWGTLYNFRFDANVPPGNNRAAFVFFKPGFPITASFTTVTPLVCNDDGICQSSESCTTCPSDCSRQGGGTGCCGNGSCEIGENPCRCASDCGAQAPNESSCGNGIDDDCDTSVDCADADCCASAACAAGDHDGDHFTAVCDCNDSDASVYPGAPQLCDGIANNCSAPGWPQTPAGEQDADGDGARPCSGDCDDADPARFPGNAEVCDGLDNDCANGVPVNEADADGDGRRLCGPDCDDANASVWATPGEVIGVLVDRDVSGAARIQWSPPAAPGGSVLGYDTVRSSSAADFMAASCLETNGSDTMSLDLAPGAPGLAAFYLVRARNACPSGLGPLGFDSSGNPHSGRSCP